MGKEQFLAVMPYISADLISMIAKKKQVTEDEAIAMLYACLLYTSSPNDSQQASIVCAQSSEQGWRIHTIAELPLSLIHI